jgi:hypothetical protein
MEKGFHWASLASLSPPENPRILQYIAATIEYNDMKVFISYGSAADQVTALRLQALAGVNGLTVYVPPANTRQSPMTVLPPEIRKKLTDGDVILGVVGAGLSQACSLEMNTGITLRKEMIVMANPEFEDTLRPPFGAKLVVIDPGNPAQTESAILQHLTTMDQNKKMALLALSTLALGLLMFAVAKD